MNRPSKRFDTPPTALVCPADSIEELPTFQIAPGAWGKLLDLASTEAKNMRSSVSSSVEQQCAADEFRVGHPPTDAWLDQSDAPESLRRGFSREYALKSEEKASRAIKELESAIMGGNTNAAYSLHRLVEEAVTVLNRLAQIKTNAFLPIAQGQSAWPILYNSTLDQEKVNEALFKTLRVGENSDLKTFKWGLKKRPRWREAEGLNRCLIFAWGCLTYLQTVVNALKQDDPPAKEFDRRCDDLLARWQPAADLGAIGMMIRELRQNGPVGSKARFCAVVISLLKMETGSHIEQIKSLRRAAIFTKNGGVAKMIIEADHDLVIYGRLKQKRLKGNRSLVPERVALDDKDIGEYLMQYLGPNEVEDAIAKVIRDRIGDSVEWLNRP
jgi:hypothetical protein